MSQTDATKTFCACDTLSRTFCKSLTSSTDGKSFDELLAESCDNCLPRSCIYTAGGFPVAFSNSLKKSADDLMSNSLLVTPDSSCYNDYGLKLSVKTLVKMAKDNDDELFHSDFYKYYRIVIPTDQVVEVFDAFADGPAIKTCDECDIITFGDIVFNDRVISVDRFAVCDHLKASYLDRLCLTDETVSDYKPCSRLEDVWVDYTLSLVFIVQPKVEWRYVLNYFPRFERKRKSALK